MWTHLVVVAIDNAWEFLCRKVHDQLSESLQQYVSGIEGSECLLSVVQFLQVNNKFNYNLASLVWLLRVNLSLRNTSFCWRVGNIPEGIQSTTAAQCTRTIQNGGLHMNLDVLDACMSSPKWPVHRMSFQVLTGACHCMPFMLVTWHNWDEL